MNISIQRCYDLLELPDGSSLAEVKNAYRIMTKVWHPDRFSSDPELRQKAEEKLKQINAAFQILQADLKKSEEKLNQINLVYEMLQDHLDTTPPAVPPIGANRTPGQTNGIGLFQNGKNALKRLSITPRFALCFAAVVVAVLVIALSTPDEKTFSFTGTPLATDPVGTPRPTRVSLHEAAADHLTKPQSLTDEDKDYYLRLRGYDPEKFEVTDFGVVSPKNMPASAEPVEKRARLPKSVKYCVVAGDLTLLSEEEPKPSENGFKILAYPKGNEVMVSGKVQIFHLNE